MEALNTKVELEKEGGGRERAEDEEAYPITIIGMKQPTRQYNYSSSLMMLSQIKLCFGGIHEAKTIVQL